MLVFHVSRGRSPSKGSGKSTLASRVNFALARGFAGTIVGYGVIGSPADSGSVSLGSSPGIPAQYNYIQLGPRRLAA